VLHELKCWILTCCSLRNIKQNLIQHSFLYSWEMLCQCFIIFRSNEYGTSHFNRFRLCNKCSVWAFAERVIHSNPKLDVIRSFLTSTDASDIFTQTPCGHSIDSYPYLFSIFLFIFAIKQSQGLFSSKSYPNPLWGPSIFTQNILGYLFTIKEPILRLALIKWR
jgi:hypothetical protein